MHSQPFALRLIYSNLQPLYSSKLESNFGQKFIVIFHFILLKIMQKFLNKKNGGKMIGSLWIVDFI